jgi:TonB-linked SusC/RagA family outer membrane protein
MNLNALRIDGVLLFLLPHKIHLIMKITTFLLLITVMTVSASGFAQKITLNAKNASLQSVLRTIHEQSGYDFFYNDEVLNKALPVNVQVKGVSLEEALHAALKGQPMSYEIEDRAILIKEAEKTIIDIPQTQLKPVAPLIIINGTVKDEQGNPMPGVTVRVKGNSTTVVTNQKGSFSVLVTTPNAILQLSFVGYIMQEIPVDQLKTPAVVVMKEDISKLDEVQVVAYGTNTKRFQTGDITTVDAKTIAKYPTDNVLNVLQGTVPGLVVYKNTGNPGGTYKVQLRGINGINGRPPLYVVDGIPFIGGGYTSRNLTLGSGTPNGTNYQGGDALSLINPLDIESISVLKDAEATGLYGTRAADGVIIITTKKGKSGAPKVDVNFYSGYTQVTHFQNMLNLKQYLQMRKEAIKNDGGTIRATDYDINGAWDTTRSTNWAKILLGNEGHVTNAQVGIGGGTENTQYRISTGYNRQTNITDLSGNNQTANLNFNINTKTNDNKFLVQLNGGYFYGYNTVPQADLTSQALTMAPDAPALYNPDGTLNFQNNTFSNPLVLKNQINNTTSTNLTSSAVLSYRPVSNLEIKANLGYNRQQINEFLGSPTTANPPFIPSISGSSYFVTDNKTSWSIEPQINYNKAFSKSKLMVTVGSSIQKTIDESTQLQAYGYTSDLLIHSITAGATITSSAPYYYSPYRLSSLFGRISYNWDNKYLLDVSGRDDGSSHFGANHQFHLFSAVGAAWIFSEENLIKNNLGFLSYGKLRGSYGVTGRDNADPYLYLDTYITAPTGSAYEGIAGLLPSGLPNPDLSWETTTKSEISLELQFLKGRISFETNFYRNHTSNVLSNTPLTQVGGFASITQNLPAVIQNQGFDMSLTFYSVHNTNFSWSTSFTFTRERNKLVSYPDLDKSTNATQLVIGQPVNIVHAYSFAGVNTQTGLYQFNSKAGAIVGGLSLVSGIDNFKLINTNPDFYGAVQNSIRYKQFTLDFLLRYIKQTGLNAFGQQLSSPPGSSVNNNYSTLVLNRWQKPGDITDIQRYGTALFTVGFGQGFATQTDHAYGDVSYIRLQNLSFAYNIPLPIVKKLHVQNVQLYIQGENLLTISKYGALDPENQSSLALPPLRTVTAGLRLTL